MKARIRRWVRRFALWLLALVDDPVVVAVSLGEGEHVCEVCGALLPADALRRHDGRWLCRPHKETP